MLGVGVGVGFGPLKVGGSITEKIMAMSPALWLDRDRGVESSDGVPAVIGDPVARWLDQSGNNRHVTQATFSQRPTVTLTALDFDGVDDNLVSPSFETPHPHTILAVFDALPTNGYLVDALEGNARIITPYEVNTVSIYAGAIIHAPYGDTTVRSVVTAVFNRANCSISRNNVIKATGDAGPINNASGVRLGAYSGGTTQRMNGTISEFLLFNRVLQEAELTFCVTHLMSKWGIA